MKMIIPVIVGAIIGYVTNWLAIKMLFRPHTERRLFGVRIPFTPGLIPKERKRIAKSVGDAVGTHLLTPDAIKQVLSSDETNEQVNRWLYEKVRSLKCKEESLCELINGEEKDKVDKINYLISENTTKFILSELRNPEFNKGIINYIDNNIWDDLIEQGIKEIRTSGVKYLGNIIRSQSVREIINNCLINEIEELKSDTRSLREISPNGIESDIKYLLDSNRISIGNGVRNIFNDPLIHGKLKHSIASMVDENINPMITIFISPDQISEKIMQIVEKYINDPKSTDDYLMLLNSLVDKLMNTSISDITSNIKPILGETNIDSISQIILAKISEEDITKILNIVENEIIKSKDTIKQGVLNYLSDSVDSLIKSEFVEVELKNYINLSIHNLMNMPISTILKDIDDSIIENLISLLRTAFNTFAAHELPTILELFNVSAIVENQINGFDVEYTEKLILDIANKELKAITWLGALLGGIMGMLSPLLQML